MLVTWLYSSILYQAHFTCQNVFKLHLSFTSLYHVEMLSDLKIIVYPTVWSFYLVTVAVWSVDVVINLLLLTKAIVSTAPSTSSSNTSSLVASLEAIKSSLGSKQTLVVNKYLKFTLKTYHLLWLWVTARCLLQIQHTEWWDMVPNMLFSHTDCLYTAAGGSRTSKLPENFLII